MPKLGTEYQSLVAEVMNALHPSATITIGEWVIGPDGRREIDISIRGIIDGRPTFVLVECKDWNSKVGIEAIDALESKRHDLGADRTIIASNSGFTAPALAKAGRNSIACVSAMVDGNEKV